MVTLFYIAIILAFTHFIYESILLPSLRLQLRYKLFSLRDKLYRLAVEQKIKADDRDFEYIEKSINTTIRNIPFMTISALYEAETFYRQNPEINAEIEKKVVSLNNMKNKELKEIHLKSISYSIRSLSMNTGMWVIYLLPFFIIYKILKTLGVHFIKIGKTVQSLSLTPDYKIDRDIFHRSLNY